MNYRKSIEFILGKYTEAGEDWEQAVLTDAPEIIDADEAELLARWLDEEADCEWGEDDRHHEIAAEIRAARPDETNGDPGQEIDPDRFTLDA